MKLDSLSGRHAARCRVSATQVAEIEVLFQALKEKLVKEKRHRDEAAAAAAEAGGKGVRPPL